jgi:hypothetical protein
MFAIGGSTQSARTVDAIQAAKAEVERIRTTEVSTEELETAKNSVLNSFVFNFDQPSKTLNRVLRYEYFGYPRDFIFQYQKAVAALTKADILRVAQEHIKPEIIAYVATGKPSDFGKPLTVLGEVKQLDLTISEPKSADVSDVKADPAAKAKGMEILARAQKALGGADNIRAVRDVELRADANMNTPQGAMQVKQHMQYLASGAIRSEQQLPFGTITVFYDGKEGWMQTPQGSSALPPPVERQVKMSLFKNLPFVLLSDAGDGRTVAAAGDNAVRISDAAGNVTTLEVDESGVPLRQRYQSQAMMGEPASVVESYSEWKTEGPLRYPAKMAIEQNGTKAMELNVTEIKVNSGLKLEDLSKKP